MIEKSKEVTDYLRAKQAVMQSPQLNNLFHVLDYEIGEMDKAWHNADDDDLPKLRWRKQAYLKLRNSLDPDLQEKLGGIGESR